MTNNEYSIPSIDHLRKLLRSFKQLEADGDITSATILLDLKAAMGDTGRPVLTKKQRQAIQIKLIENHTAPETAKLLGITLSAVAAREVGGLRKVLSELNNGPILHNRYNEEWPSDMVRLLFNADLTIDDLVSKTGKSPSAVKKKMSKLRGKGERVPYRTTSRPTARTSA